MNDSERTEKLRELLRDAMEQQIDQAIHEVAIWPIEQFRGIAGTLFTVADLFATISGTNQSTEARFILQENLNGDITIFQQC